MYLISTSKALHLYNQCIVTLPLMYPMLYILSLSLIPQGDFINTSVVLQQYIQLMVTGSLKAFHLYLPCIAPILAMYIDGYINTMSVMPSMYCTHTFKSFISLINDLCRYVPQPWQGHLSQPFYNTGSFSLPPPGS